jgi:hypothetical protein
MQSFFQKFNYSTVHVKESTPNIRVGKDSEGKTHIFIINPCSLKDFVRTIQSIFPPSKKDINYLDLSKIVNLLTEEIYQAVWEFTADKSNERCINLQAKRVGEHHVKILSEDVSISNKLGMDWQIKIEEIEDFVLNSYSEVNVEVNIAKETPERVEIEVKLPGCFFLPADLSADFITLGKQKYFLLTMSKSPNWQFMNLLKTHNHSIHEKLQHYEFTKEKIIFNYTKHGKISIVVAIPSLLVHHSAVMQNGILIITLFK